MNSGLAPSQPSALLARRISLFSGVIGTIPINEMSVADALAGVKEGMWSKPVTEIRNAFAESGKARANDLKRANLPAFTFSGTFRHRANGALVQPSGLLSLDFDSLGAGLAAARRRLAEDNHALAIFLSPSGNGLKVLVPITAANAEEHRACFKTAADHFKAIGLIPDPTGKDVARLCFVSWDSDCWIAEPEARISPFCLQSAPIICTLHSTPTLYTTGPEDERVLLARARGEANLYLAQIKPTASVLVGLYQQILADRAQPGLHQRNEWLCQTVPFLFRAFSSVVGVELAVLHLKAYGGLYSGSEAEHRASFESLWSGLESPYTAELSDIELRIYNTFAEPERSAFRICRDLAIRGEGFCFFLACDHFAMRLAPPGALNGWRLLRTFERLKIIETVKKGNRRAKGQRAPATTYRWTLPV